METLGSKGLAIQAWGPEFEPLTAPKKLGVAAHTCNPSTDEVSLGRSLGLAGWPA